MSTSNMTPASEAKAGDKKSQGKATKPKAPGRHNAFSDVKLEFLESFKDRYLESNASNCGILYRTVAQEFFDWFGFVLAIGDNPELDNADDKHTPPKIELLPPEEQNTEVAR